MRERSVTEAALEQEPKQRHNFFQCPECLDKYETPEDFGRHLVRHEEMGRETPPGKRGKPTSEPCPKGCGRHFRVKQRCSGHPLRVHLLTCEGSKPLIQGTPSMQKFVLLAPPNRARA
jgi:uncharacterized C2H2 Zn-finger protein